jgi:uncharacterized cupredoxin-like copper-binding protein
MDDALQSRINTVQLLLAVLVAAVVALGVVLDGKNYVVVFGFTLAVVAALATVTAVVDS